jgi:hypothetical protein
MFAVTSSYERKDGTRARHYQCRGYNRADGTCDVKVNAEAVDTAVLENLPKLMPRFDEWAGQIEDRHAAERKRLQEARDQAVEEVDAQRRKVEKAEDRFLTLDADDQELLQGALRRVRADLGRLRSEPKQRPMRSTACRRTSLTTGCSTSPRRSGK